jgi:hypothetical protein
MIIIKRIIIKTSTITHIVEPSTPPTIVSLGTVCADGCKVGCTEGAADGTSVGPEDGTAEGTEEGMGEVNTRSGATTTATSYTALWDISVWNFVYPAALIVEPVDPVSTAASA